jgi:hypothetical protein
MECVVIVAILPDSGPSLGRGGPRTAIFSQSLGVKRNIFVAVRISAFMPVHGKRKRRTRGPPRLSWNRKSLPEVVA